MYPRTTARSLFREIVLLPEDDRRTDVAGLRCMVREVEKILFVEAFEAGHYPPCLVGETQCRNGIECVVRRDVKFVVQGDLKGQVVKVHEFGGVVWTALRDTDHSQLGLGKRSMQPFDEWGGKVAGCTVAFEKEEHRWASGVVVE